MPRKAPPIAIQSQKPDAEWFQKRLIDAGYSARAISLKLGRNVHKWNRTINGIEKGGETIYQQATIGDAIAFAQLLRAPFDEVLRRLGYRLPEATIPVVGKVGASGRIQRIAPALQLSPARIPAPPNVSPNAEALYVDAAKRSLALLSGQYLIYEPRRGIDVGAIGHLAVIDVNEEPAPVVGILERASVSRGSVNILGLGEEVLESVAVSSASPILWQMAG